MNRKCSRRTAGKTMNWDRIEGQWKQGRGKAVRHWGRMMNDELAGAAGRYEQLVGQLQERYGRVREEAGDHVARVQVAAEQLKKINRKLMDLLDSMTGVKRSHRPASLGKAGKRKNMAGSSAPRKKRRRPKENAI